MYITALLCVAVCYYIDVLSICVLGCGFFFFSSRRRHTRWNCDWSSDVCSSDLHLHAATSRQKGAVSPRRRRRRVPVFVLNRKSTRLNSSHSSISYAVFCLKKKTKTNHQLMHTTRSESEPDPRHD